MSWTWRTLTAAEPGLLRLERDALACGGGADWIAWQILAIRLDQLASRWAESKSWLRHVFVWRLAWRWLRACFETGRRPREVEL
jgi:hypothetical protein